jgi:hypothetical protein
MMRAPAPTMVQCTGNPQAEEMKRLRPYKVLALVNSWKNIVTQENVWCVTGLKRSDRYSMTVVTRLRRHRFAKTKYPSRKLAALPT